MSEIGIIGYFGYKNNQIDGQTIKTRQVYDLVKRNYKNSTIKFVDTQELQSKKLKTILKLLNLGITSKTIIYLPGQNNLQHFFLILLFISQLFKNKIIYPVVGGWLPEFISDKQRLANGLKRIKAVLVESDRMKNELCELGFHNVHILQNFRISDFRPIITSHKKTKFIFMARIMPEKGCDIIFESVRHLSANDDFEVDFYGQINKDYEKSFFDQISQFDTVSYKGCIAPELVFNTLSNYDCTLLPTYYDGEGFPGTIVDSFISGVPVIVSDWKDLRSFVKEKETGFIIPVKNHRALAKAMLGYMSLSEANKKSMKLNALKESAKYDEKKAWDVFSQFL